MNVTFHALGSFATAAVLSLGASENWRSISALKKYAIGFAAGILVHGILDYLPHSYPLPSKFDVIFAISLSGGMLYLVQKQNRFLVLVCFAGCVFPDVVDLSPTIIKKYLDIEIPALPFRVFPWHLKKYSGSIYDGSRQIESNIYHFSFLLICFGLLYANRKRFFRFYKIEE